MIPVTKPFLPPIEEYQKYQKEIWGREWLTNHGPLVNELELNLKELLGLDHLLFLSNGTIAIQIAIKALELKGEIITTPFTYVATTSTIFWENCTPVYADIDKQSLNIDPAEIEKKITSKTSAILATHVYGNPCDIDAIERIAKKHNLKVIYDAAHCFGVKYKGRSIFEYGDISTCSFHATKIFQTIEGGAVMTKDLELHRKMSRLRNFGHTSAISFEGVGVNGKNSEFHAAMGLCNLRHWKEIQETRKRQFLYYNEILNTLAVTQPLINSFAEYNYSYYPLVFQSQALMLKAIEILNLNSIYPRRYFYPALTVLDYTPGQNCPLAEDIAARVLCLPIYHNLTKEEQNLIARLLKRA